MKKLKDFFYDKNDIFIVLLIVAVAVFIIYTRIGSIMDYPQQYAKEVAASTTVATETTTVATEPTTATEETVSDITIEIADSDTSTSVCEKLQEAGLIESAEDFDAYILEEGKSSSINSGTFQIPSDASDEEILNIIS